jgi:malate synthase
VGTTAVSGVDVRAPVEGRAGEILTPEALRFLGDLERRFRERRADLLGARRERHVRIAAGEPPGFLSETREIRESDWQVAPAPPDLQDRRVEITGPVERKMMINALNSGARCFMADFEDATSPTWTNLVEGHANLVDAVEGTIELETEEGKRYELADEVATLIVRPRGWHLPERHVLVDGEPMSGSLFDFGLFVFHNGARLLESGSGPYLYLPKLEAHAEARLWKDVLEFAEETLGLEPASIRATVLVETILAAFEMHEILYELRDRIVGLNAGRWDYIFSVIKRFAHRPEFVLPDRSQVTMTVPFMRAYTELLVQTCHRRGAHAMGGMAAFVPSRRDPEVNETALAKVREDKLREAGDGFDGTWVAHPDLVPVAAEVFEGVLGERPHQVDRQRDDVHVEAGDLLNVTVPGGAVTPDGLDNNVSVAIRYVESWLRGVGAVALYNLMEDAATAEIARSQVWQWLRHGRVTREEVEAAEQRELAETSGGRFGDAAELFEDVSLGDELVEFLTLPGYDRLD